MNSKQTLLTILALVVGFFISPLLVSATNQLAHVGGDHTPEELLMVEHQANPQETTAPEESATASSIAIEEVSKDVEVVSPTGDAAFSHSMNNVLVVIVVSILAVTIFQHVRRLKEKN